jgi:hypothetical protein
MLARARRGEDAARAAETVGVLMPLRIETRFSPGRLRVLIVPDGLWLAVHDPRPTEGELRSLARFLEAADGAETPALEQAWRELAAAVGNARAVYLVRTFVDTTTGQPPRVRPVAPGDLQTEPRLPQVIGFPETLDLWLARGGNPPELVASSSVDTARLLADFPDPELADDRRWWESWDEAKKVGLGLELGLPGDPNDIRRLVVTGLSGKGPGDLWAAHRDAGRIGLVAPGAATNSVEGAPAAHLGDDPGTWLRVLTDPAEEADRLVSQALTGDPDLLGNLPGAADPHRAWASAMVTALWPALWGFAGADVWGVVPGTGRAAGWAAHALFPEGPFPTLRVGAQPYGLLPATALRRWKGDDGDPEVEPDLARALPELRDRWRAAAEARGTAVGASTADLLDLLAHVPSSPGFRQRRAYPLELWWLASLVLGFSRPFDAFERVWSSRYEIARALGLEPRRRYGSRGFQRRVELPLVLPEGADRDGLVDIIKRLIDAARRAPSAFADLKVLVAEFLQRRPDSLLLGLVIRSLQVAIGDVGRELQGQEPPELDPIVRSDRDPSLLERWIRSVEPGALDSGSPAAEAFGRVEAGVARLTDVPVPELERMLRATVDTAAFRIDPWIVGIATRRLGDLLDAGADLRLGAYGWVDRPRPGTPGPTAGGLLTAPSPAQALTATVVRDRAVNDAEPGRWDLDLTSTSVRTAERLAEEVRQGAHVSEALGREVERVVGVGTDVDRLRRDFPVRDEHGGRRTLDGVRVLAADPSALGLDAARLAGLDALRAAIEAYGDLLVAEAVHHVTEGRADVAGAAMDAAAGLGRPPELGVLRTPRAGRALATSAVLLLSAVAELPQPADPLARAELSPAALADVCAAAFVAAQAGGAGEWSWTVSDPASGAGDEVTLADLGLHPADALALPLTDLERLVAEAAVLPPGDGRAVVSTGGGARYERAARLVAMVGRAPAGPDAVAEDPAATVSQAAVDADLEGRYSRLHATAAELSGLLIDQLTLAGPDGSLGAADRTVLERLVAALRRWGIAPDPGPEVTAGVTDPGEAGDRRLVATAIRGAALLAGRLDAAPDPAAAGPPARGDLVAAMAGLASPTGQLAITGRLRRDDLPELEPPDPAAAAPLEDWLSVVAAVRLPLAAVEVHQLTAGTAAGTGPALRAWTTKPDDLWQLDPEDARRLVVAFGGAALDPGTLPAGAPVAAAALDRWAEVVPDEEHAAAAAFGFDAPASRPPQAILLAVPPAPGQPLDSETLVAIVDETRELAHARMARPVDLGPEVRGLLPTALLPATGPSAVTLDPTRE